MKYEQKNCPFCLHSSIQKHSKQNNLQRYKCTYCNKTFTFKSKLGPAQIWLDYSVGKQTRPQLAIKYDCYPRTIRQYLEKAAKSTLNSPKKTTNRTECLFKKLKDKLRFSQWV